MQETAKKQKTELEELIEGLVAISIAVKCLAKKAIALQIIKEDLKDE